MASCLNARNLPKSVKKTWNKNYILEYQSIFLFLNRDEQFGTDEFFSFRSIECIGDTISNL